MYQPPPHFAQIVKENFTEGQWQEFVQSLTLELQGRIAATPELDLPKLKHNIVYLGELGNVFHDIFHPKGK